MPMKGSLKKAMAFGRALLFGALSWAFFLYPAWVIATAVFL